MLYFRTRYLIFSFLFVFGWGIGDSIFEYTQDVDTSFIEKYTDQSKRSVIFGFFNFLWLTMRLMSIIFFANALCRFWIVFREVKDENTKQERGSFFLHLFLVLIYFISMGLIATFFTITAKTGVFYSRLWLWTFVLATFTGFANYILIIIVAMQMFVYSMAGQ